MLFKSYKEFRLNSIMGIDYTGCEAILHSFDFLTNRENMLTLGRQEIHMNSLLFDYVLDKNNLRELKGRYHGGYCEGFFKDNGFKHIDSLDYSSYEGVNIVHNMNQPIHFNHNKYDYILDTGTTEHIFNTPQVCENIINLLNIGGIYVSITPNNNQSGHGIYQFSPEFYLSAYSKKYGMEVLELYLAVVNTDPTKWIRVNDFNQKGNGRNTSKFNSNDPVYIIAIIKKISNDRLNLITNSPNQYSYENIDWVRQNT